MSAIKNFGKDTVIFATKEDHAIPSKIELPSSEAQPGLLLPSGDINWNCPCLGGMATGPCGVEFREAFSCFHYSDAEPKGSDCYETFKTMQDCMSTYPTVYNHNTDDSLGIDLDAIDLDGDEDDLSGKKGSSRREVEYADGEDADDIKTEVKKEVELAAK